MAEVNDSLRNREQRLVYLVTYSRADVEKVATREAFAEKVSLGWMEMTGVKVVQWVVARELHADAGVSESNSHYHMAMKLEKRARWLKVRQFLDDRYGIRVNFSAVHNTYYSAYKYTTKEDDFCVHSEGHPDLSNARPPRTEKAISGKKRKAVGRTGGKKTKRKRGLSVYEVAQFIQAKNVKSRLQLLSIAASQNREGKTELAEFICNRGGKAVDECLAIAQELATAEAKYERSQKTRMQLLHESYSAECVSNCEGKWLEAAVNLLNRNEISVSVFAQAVLTLLEKGRGKYRNLFIHGVANCGKSFVLAPLKSMYGTFCNPATGTFAWVGAEEAEIIMLNDFRWKPSIIAWADMLLLLEGDIVHLPAPKNFSKRDIELSNDTPIFATSDAPIVYIKGGSVCHANTEMMNVRWRFFHFWRQIPPAEQLQLIPCGHCFSKLILDNITE
ncbi:hypothetical protein ABFA07_002349 [Porites harrisoni]